MKKLKLLTAVAVAVVIGAGIFYACQKDSQLQDSLQQQKRIKSLICNLENPIGTISVPEGEMLCATASVEELWYENEGKQKLIGFSHTTTIQKCDGESLLTVNFIAKLHDITIIDYSDINNFSLYVDDQIVTPDFSYDKTFEYITITEDENVLAVSGIIHITYNDIVNVWSEISSQMNWEGDNDIIEETSVWSDYFTVSEIYQVIGHDDFQQYAVNFNSLMERLEAGGEPISIICNEFSVCYQNFSNQLLFSFSNLNGKEEYFYLLFDKIIEESGDGGMCYARCPYSNYKWGNAYCRKMDRLNKKYGTDLEFFEQYCAEYCRLSNKLNNKNGRIIIPTGQSNCGC